MADVVTMDKIISLCRRRGFIFQSSEIYGGLNGAYDYGPMGVELKNNIRDFWWKEMTRMHDNIVGLDASILMHPRVWEASGHVSNFTDPMVDCKVCKSALTKSTLTLHAQCVETREHLQNQETSTLCSRPISEPIGMQLP